jgi:molecular chaperone DnaK (HSP70)
MEVSSGKVEVIVIDGNRRLGGADWDGRLYDLVAEKFRVQAGLSEDPTDDEDFAQRLLNEVETCKKTLSRKEKSTIRCSYADVVEMIEVTRAEFEQATASLVEETLDIVQRSLDSAQAKRPGLTLDEVLLVGGSSRMPMIQESLKARFGWNLRLTDFDLAVAKGAAIYAQGGMLAETTAGGAELTEAGSPDAEPTDKMLRLNGRAVMVKNVLSRGIGIRLIRDNARTGRPEHYIGFLAHANESLPINVEQTVYTYSAGATEIAIDIFEQQGERESEVVEHNKELTPESGATFTGLPYLPKESPIDIKLFINTEGLATLAAFEPQSAQNLEIGVRLSVMQAEDEARAKEIVASLSRRV